jgi:hypothetical protein
MIRSSKAITLVLVSAASVLSGYGLYHNSAFDEGPDEYFDSSTQPTTRTPGSHGSGYYSGRRYSGGHGYFWGGSSSSSGGGGYSGSSSSSAGAHGTSHGGFGGTAHGSSGG